KRSTAKPSQPVKEEDLLRRIRAILNSSNIFNSNIENVGVEDDFLKRGFLDSISLIQVALATTLPPTEGRC
ncbi:MAG: hypothetical protein Q7J64_06235, partial [Elusimicrobiota bacterium]|nr:hypothetical protein [Elusimicrobiota bacterium]